MKTKVRLVALLALTLLLLNVAVSPVPAQSPEPPEIQENGEFPLDLNALPQALDERSESTVTLDGNQINAVTTWWSTSGTVFVPADSTYAYGYGGDGCVDPDALSFFRGIVNLPQGSTITGMYFNYANDVAAPTDTNIVLRRYSWTGAYDDILTVNGIQDGIGNHTTFTSTVAYNIVNNFDYAYVLVWTGRPDQNLCGVNLRYTPPPIYLQALPLINR